MKARSQAWHRQHNANHYPGTRQMCEHCAEPTDRCEDDSLYLDDGYGPLCPTCFHFLKEEKA